MARPSGYHDPTKDGGQDLTHILNNKMATSASRNGGGGSVGVAGGGPQFITPTGQPLHDITDLMIKGVSPAAGHQVQLPGNGLGLPPHQ